MNGTTYTLVTAEGQVYAGTDGKVAIDLNGHAYRELDPQYAEELGTFLIRAASEARLLGKVGTDLRIAKAVRTALDLEGAKQ